MTNAGWMDDVIRDNVVQLFPEFSMIDCPIASDGPTLTGLIGFSGPHIHGALGIMGGDDSLQRTAPQHITFDANDWVGELANRALGRIKTAMLRAGIEIQASTPVVLHGVSLSVVRRDHVRTFVLKHENRTIHLWVDYTPISDVSAEDLTPVEDDEILGSGETLFF
jgi:hypothetical protein